MLQVAPLNCMEKILGFVSHSTFKRLLFLFFFTPPLLLQLPSFPKNMLAHSCVQFPSGSSSAEQISATAQAQLLSQGRGSHMWCPWDGALCTSACRGPLGCLPTVSQKYWQWWRFLTLYPDTKIKVETVILTSCHLKACLSSSLLDLRLLGFRSAPLNSILILHVNGATIPSRGLSDICWNICCFSFCSVRNP